MRVEGVFEGQVGQDDAGEERVGDVEGESVLVHFGGADEVFSAEDENDEGEGSEVKNRGASKTSHLNYSSSCSTFFQCSSLNKHIIMCVMKEIRDIRQRYKNSVYQVSDAVGLVLLGTIELEIVSLRLVTLAQLEVLTKLLSHLRYSLLIHILSLLAVVHAGQSAKVSQRLFCSHILFSNHLSLTLRHSPESAEFWVILQIYRFLSLSLF